MILTEIEKHVKPLSRAEKWKLIRIVQDMLMEEETLDLQSLSRSGSTYPLFTPIGLEEGAAKLQRYLHEGKL